MNKYEFAEHIAEQVCISKFKKEKTAFVGMNEETIFALIREKLLDGYPFQFFSDQSHPYEIERYGIEIHPLNLLHEFKPDKIYIIEFFREPGIQLYEKIIREFSISPKQIYLSDKHWDATFVSGDDFTSVNVPESIKGGVFPGIERALFDCIRDVVRSKTPGAIVNFGVFAGWSTYFIAESLRVLGEDRTIYGFDTFAGMPHDEDQDATNCLAKINDGKSLDYNINIETVQKNLAKFNNIELVQGDIKDTISHLNDLEVALAFFDMDDLTPTACCLPTVYNNLAPNGFMVFDHYEYNTLCKAAIGQRLAMVDFLNEHYMFHISGTNIFIKR